MLHCDARYWRSRVEERQLLVKRETLRLGRNVSFGVNSAGKPKHKCKSGPSAGNFFEPCFSSPLSLLHGMSDDIEKNSEKLCEKVTGSGRKQGRKEEEGKEEGEEEEKRREVGLLVSVLAVIIPVVQIVAGGITDCGGIASAKTLHTVSNFDAFHSFDNCINQVPDGLERVSGSFIGVQSLSLLLKGLDNRVMDLRSELFQIAFRSIVGVGAGLSGR